MHAVRRGDLGDDRAGALHPMPGRHVSRRYGRVHQMPAPHDDDQRFLGGVRNVPAGVGSQSERHALRPVPGQSLPCNGQRMPAMPLGFKFAARQRGMHAVPPVDGVSRLLRVPAGKVHGILRGRYGGQRLLLQRVPRGDAQPAARRQERRRVRRMRYGGLCSGRGRRQLHTVPGRLQRPKRCVHAMRRRHIERRRHNLHPVLHWNLFGCSAVDGVFTMHSGDVWGFSRHDGLPAVPCRHPWRRVQALPRRHLSKQRRCDRVHSAAPRVRRG